MLNQMKKRLLASPYQKKGSQLGAYMCIVPTPRYLIRHGIPRFVVASMRVVPTQRSDTSHRHDMAHNTVGSLPQELNQCYSISLPERDTRMTRLEKESPPPSLPFPWEQSTLTI